MGNTFRVINYGGDIEISIYKKANAVFKTNEYNETEDVCIYKETINIFDLLKENQELKKQLEERNIEYFKGAYDTHNKCYNQQKEFIKYLEDKIETVENKIFNLPITSNERNYLVNVGNGLIEILQKYKEIIGDDK